MKLLIILAATLVACLSFAATGDNNQKDTYRHCYDTQEFLAFNTLQEGDVIKFRIHAPISTPPKGNSSIEQWSETLSNVVTLGNFHISDGHVARLNFRNLENHIVDFSAGHHEFTVMKTKAPNASRLDIKYLVKTENGSQMEMLFNEGPSYTLIDVAKIVDKYSGEIGIFRNHRRLTTEDIPIKQKCDELEIERRDAELRDVILEDNNRDA